MLKSYPDMCFSHRLRHSFVHFLLANMGAHWRTQLRFRVCIKQLTQEHTYPIDENVWSLQSVSEKAGVELYHG